MECEVCLGKCSEVVRWWIGENDALRIFYLTTFLDTALSQVLTYTVFQAVHAPAHTSCPLESWQSYFVHVLFMFIPDCFVVFPFS